MGAKAVDLLENLSRLGIELVAHGDRLRYRPRSAVTADLLERLKVHRDELLAILRASGAPGEATTAPATGEKMTTMAVEEMVTTVDEKKTTMVGREMNNEATEEKITVVSEFRMGTPATCDTLAASPEPALRQDCIEPPPACPGCGGQVFWWNPLGDRRCMNCDPPITAILALERVEVIRRRQRIPSPIGAKEMLADLKRLTDT